MPMDEFQQPRSKALRDALGRARQQKSDEPAMLSVPEACKRLGFSEWMLYQQINTGKLASVKVGSRRLIPLRAITEFIQNLEEQAGA